MTVVVTDEERCEAHLREALALAGKLLELADRGDEVRQDVGCGVLYGTVRDCAYKIQALARKEIRAHRLKLQPRV